MSICCCSLVGTAARKHCSNNSDAESCDNKIIFTDRTKQNYLKINYNNLDLEIQNKIKDGYSYSEIYEFIQAIFADAMYNKTIEEYNKMIRQGTNYD